MGNVGDIERITQDYLVTLLKDKLGYTYPGNWEAPHNSNIEESFLNSYLSKKEGHL